MTVLGINYYNIYFLFSAGNEMYEILVFLKKKKCKMLLEHFM